MRHGISLGCAGPGVIQPVRVQVLKAGQFACILFEASGCD